MKLIDAVNWDEVKETAKFYYTDETTTLNLYPALIISILLLFLLVPILGAIPTIDLFPSTSGGNHTLNIYDKVGCHMSQICNIAASYLTAQFLLQ